MYHPTPANSLTAMPVATPLKQRTPRVAARAIASDQFLLQYIEGWNEADPAKIADAASTDYRFVDPLVGCFDRNTLPYYFALLRQRVGFGSPAGQQGKVCLDRFPSARWPTQRLRFWRSIPECGLAGICDVELRAGRVHQDVVCYEPNMASELLWGARTFRVRRGTEH